MQNAHHSLETSLLHNIMYLFGGSFKTTGYHNRIEWMFKCECSLKDGMTIIWNPLHNLTCRRRLGILINEFIKGAIQDDQID